MNILLKIDQNTNLQLLYSLSVFFESLRYKVYVETFSNQYQHIHFDYTLILSQSPRIQNKSTSIIKNTKRYWTRIDSNIFFKNKTIPQKATNIHMVKNMQDILEEKCLEPHKDNPKILSQKYLDYINNKFSTVTK